MANLVTCPSCNRLYGRHSITIHQPQCQERSHGSGTNTLAKASGKQPKKVSVPKTLQHIPQTDNDILGKVRISYINGTEFGTDTYVVKKSDGLSKLMPDTYTSYASPGYQRQAKQFQTGIATGSTNPPLTEEQLNIVAYEEFNKSLIPCRICNRTFRQGIIADHMRLCGRR